LIIQQHQRKRKKREKGEIFQVNVEEGRKKKSVLLRGAREKSAARILPAEEEGEKEKKEDLLSFLHG